MFLFRRAAFCGLSLALVGCLAGVIAAKANEPVRILYNGKIFTADSEYPYAEAIAIRGEEILAVGSLPEVTAVAGSNAERIDLQGNSLLPGFIDSHSHTIYGGINRISADASEKVQSIPKTTSN